MQMTNMNCCSISDSSPAIRKQYLLPSALDEFETITSHLKYKELALFIDYDGTLTPIVDQPDDATLLTEHRDILNDLSKKCVVTAIVGGRDCLDVARLVALEHLIYAGSHGLDISGPKIKRRDPGGESSLKDLNTAENQLTELINTIKGARVERKRYAISIHYRDVDSHDVNCLKKAVDVIHRYYPNLRKQYGKKVIELLPNCRWNKGEAVRWLLKTLSLSKNNVLPLYIGDDVTDEYAFHSLEYFGISIVVGNYPSDTNAKYCLNDPTEVMIFFNRLMNYMN